MGNPERWKRVAVLKTGEQAAYDTFAAYYDPSDLNREPEIRFYTGLIRAQDRSLLELACGTGTITTRLAKQLASQHGTAARIVGLDVSAEMLTIARSRYSGV